MKENFSNNCSPTLKYRLWGKYTENGTEKVLRIQKSKSGFLMPLEVMTVDQALKYIKDYVSNDPMNDKNKRFFLKSGYVLDPSNSYNCMSIQTFNGSPRLVLQFIPATNATAMGGKIRSKKTRKTRGRRRNKRKTMRIKKNK